MYGWVLLDLSTLCDSIAPGVDKSSSSQAKIQFKSNCVIVETLTLIPVGLHIVGLCVPRHSKQNIPQRHVFTKYTAFCMQHNALQTFVPHN